MQTGNNGSGSEHQQQVLQPPIRSPAKDGQTEGQALPDAMGEQFSSYPSNTDAGHSRGGHSQIPKVGSRTSLAELLGSAQNSGVSAIDSPSSAILLKQQPSQPALSPLSHTLASAAMVTEIQELRATKEEQYVLVIDYPFEAIIFLSLFS
jgi:hypothetical protein